MFNLKSIIEVLLGLVVLVLLTYVLINVPIKSYMYLSRNIPLIAISFISMFVIFGSLLMIVGIFLDRVIRADREVDINSFKARVAVLSYSIVFLSVSIFFKSQEIQDYQYKNISDMVTAGPAAKEAFLSLKDGSKITHDQAQKILKAGQVDSKNKKEAELKEQHLLDKGEYKRNLAELYEKGKK